MRLVVDLLRSARAGRGGSLVVTGPAGIGKTRLLSEAATRAAISGMQVVRVPCQAGDLLRPLAGVVDLVPQILSLRGAAGADPKHVERLKRVMDVGHATTDLEIPQTSPDVLRAQIVAALIDVLDAASNEAPVLLEVDDLQWADASLSWLWDRLLAWSTAESVAWLFAFRGTPTDIPPIKTQSLSLGSLDAAPAGALLENVIALLGRSLKSSVRESLLLRAGGNPLFLRELGRQWALSGSNKVLPASLVLLLDNGVAKLSAPALRTLQAAAVLGTHANTERIERVVEMSRAQFVDGLLELDQAGILTTDECGTAYGHVLWADAAMSRVSPSVLRVLHRHAAQCLENELERGPSPALLWEVARQWEAAGNRDGARAALVRGAEYLARQGFPAEAASAYERAERACAVVADKLSLLARRVELLGL
jgi:predicted ATPase